MFFLWASLLQHPFPDVRPTVQDRHARRLTRVEKTNTFYIDKIQFLQIQNDWRFAVFDFGFDLIQVPDSQLAAEPDPALVPFNPQRHFPPTRKTVTAVQVAGHLQLPVAVELRPKRRPDF
jgi:hypothetical protein